MPEINVSFKFSGQSFDLMIDTDQTVGLLKTQIESSGHCGELTSSGMRLIFKGRILKDDDVKLDTLGIDAGNTIHIVRNAASTPAAPAPAVATSTPTSTNPSTTSTTNNTSNVVPANTADAFAAMGLPGGMFGGMDMNALAGMGLGGMGAGQAGVDQNRLQAAMEAMNNPMMSQMMQQMMQMPGFSDMLTQQVRNDPYMQQMVQANPMFGQLLNDPQFMQSMFQPERMQQMMNVSRMLGGMGGADQSAAGVPNLNTLLGAMNNLGTAAPSNSAGAAPGGMDMNALMAAMGGMGGMGGNASNAGGMDMSALMAAMGGMGGAADSRPPAERYANQLSQLENMGFIDRDANIQALTAAHGDVNEAITILLSRGLGN